MPKVKRWHDRNGPRRDDVERLVEHIDTLVDAGDPRAVRDAPIVRLLNVGSMRRAGVAGLQLAHIQSDHSDGPLILAGRNGRRERQPMLISARCAEALRGLLRVRHRGLAIL
ncbi:MAG: hypothetical protein JNK15_11060 [Planctomycetes bacterium]|nr:hypothetical protein [Planctomycetota bacterium]